MHGSFKSGRYKKAGYCSMRRCRQQFKALLAPAIVLSVFAASAQAKESGYLTPESILAQHIETEQTEQTELSQTLAAKEQLATASSSTASSVKNDQAFLYVVPHSVMNLHARSAAPYIRRKQANSVSPFSMNQSPLYLLPISILSPQLASAAPEIDQTLSAKKSPFDKNRGPIYLFPRSIWNSQVIATPPTVKLAAANSVTAVENKQAYAYLLPTTILDLQLEPAKSALYRALAGKHLTYLRVPESMYLLPGSIAILSIKHLRAGTSRVAIEKTLPPIANQISIETQVPHSSASETPTNEWSGRAKTGVEPEQVNQNSTRMLQVGSDVPAGFEALAGPRFMFVDVFFNEKMIGSTGITIDNELIFFDDAQEVARWLATYVTDERLSQWLLQPMPTNGHLACFDINDPEGCGQIEATPFALIYNAMLLRLDIFIASSSQSAATQLEREYLSASETQGAAIVSIHGVASDFSTGTSRTDLTGNVLLGKKRTHIRSSVQYNDIDNQINVSTLQFTHHWNDYQGDAGTFSFSPGGAVGSIDLIGAGFSTSFKSRVDIEKAIGSQIALYLPKQSVVQILIDGRVYSGKSYPAGNQTLDTRALPEGTYEVELLINDSTQGTRSETRLFTKSTQLPPKDRWILNGAAGTLRSYEFEDEWLPISTGKIAASLSASHRLGDRSAFKLGVLQHDETSVGLGEFIYLGPRLSLNFALGVGEMHLATATLQASVRTGRHHWGLSATHFSSSNTVVESELEADNASSLFLQDSSLLDLTMNGSSNWGSYGARLGLVQNEASQLDEADNTQSNFSAFAQKPVSRTRNHRGFLGLRYLRDNNQNFAQLSLNFHFGRDAWRASTGVDIGSNDAQGDSWQVRSAGSWRTRTSPIGAISAGAYTSKSSTKENYGVNAEVKNSWIRAQASTDISNPDTSATQSNSIASFSAQAAFDNDGASIGGSSNAQAGVIVDVRGEPQGAGFDILVNNIEVSSSRIGQPQFVSLQAFKNYEIKLRPHTLVSNGVGDAAHSLTLFPGNVERITIEAKKRVLMVGMIVDSNGEIINNAAVKTERGNLVIDESGFLQAEVYQGEVFTVRRRNQSVCEVVVKIENTDEEVVVLDEPLVCALSSVEEN